MRRDELQDLSAFLAVAEARSFTRAAAQLGVSQSALSHTVRRLEQRLGLRLLTRTTRSVAPTEAGVRLVATLRPALDDIGAQVAALGELRAKPSGTVRINTSEHAARTILWPAIARLMPAHPDVSFELTIDQGLSDIVGDGYDAGVRLGEHLAKDMIAVRIGPEMRMVVIGAPAYFATRPAPVIPQDLAEHECINLRLATHGGLYAWEFEKDGRALKVRVDGRLVFNDVQLIMQAACEGLGLAFVPADRAAPYLADGRLVQALDDWCPPFAGYHLYYPSRRQQRPAFALLVEALRYRD